MKSLHITTIAIALFAGLSCSGSASSTTGASDTPDAPDAPGFAFRIDTLYVPSKSMDSSVRTLVVVPGAAQAATPCECPVVYLLHGAYCSADTWFDVRSDLGDLADKYGFILVCADAGNSWYIDSPIVKDSQFETFFADEIIPFIDGKYPTIKTREGRVITGASMGGHGAMFIAMRHPGLFGAAGSMSGALDFRRNNYLTTMVEALLGSYNSHMKEFYDHTAVAQVSRISDGDLALIVDCGTEDFIFSCTEDFHIALNNKGIAHTYRLRPGKHENEYWSVSLPEHLDFFKEYFEKQK